MTAADFVCPRADEEAWLAARKTGIGSSDAPVLVLGRAYGRTPLDLFMEKVGTVTARRDESEAMKWGARMEGVVLGQFFEEHGGWENQAIPHGLWRNKATPFLIATPDAWLSDVEFDEVYEGTGPLAGVPKPGTRTETIVECKAFGTLEGWEEGVPDYPRIQAQHQMAVLGLPFCYVAALGGGYGGMRFLWARVERDDAFIDGTLLPLCEAFWRCVEAKEPPAPGPEDSKAVALLAGAPIEGKLVQLDASWIEHADELAEAEAQAAEACKVVETLKNGFKACMGDATEAILPDGRRLSWRPNTKGVRVFKGPR